MTKAFSRVNHPNLGDGTHICWRCHLDLNVSYQAIFSWKHLKNFAHAPPSTNCVGVRRNDEVINCYVSLIGIPFLSGYKTWQNISGPFLPEGIHDFLTIQTDGGVFLYDGMGLKELYWLLFQQDIVWAEICTIIRVIWNPANGSLIDQVCYFEKTDVELKWGEYSFSNGFFECFLYRFYHSHQE